MATLVNLLRLEKKTVMRLKNWEVKMKVGILGALLAASAFGPAWAGGFERSGAPLGFMFEAGSYGELSYSHVNPKVSGTTLVPTGGGAIPAGTTTGNISKAYSSVGLSFKTDLTGNLSLGVMLDPSYGADQAYPSGTGYLIAGTRAELNGDTVALIGRYKINDAVSVHAGVRSVGIGGNASVVTPQATYTASYQNDRGTGYLVGVAYEKPEIALRVALTYASETKHDLATSVVGVGPVGSEQIELPKSLTLDAQSGIAANTLLFGSIRWVDWTSSRLNSIGYPTPPLVSHANDSITYTLGLGRKFSETWSGAVSFGYEDSKGGVASNLSPTDGYVSVGIGGTYTRGNMKISGGVRYVNIGDANSLSGATAFRDNSAIGIGLKVGFTF